MRNENRIRADLIHCLQQIFRTRIHRLSAFDQAIDSQIPENLIQSVTNGNRNKSIRLS